MAKLTTFPRNCQINCPIELCHMLGRCQYPRDCGDVGYLWGQRPEAKKPSKEKASDLADLPFPLVMRRTVCCKGAEADGEPCKGCPNVIPF